VTVAILIDTDILIDASRKVDLAVDFIAGLESEAVPGISLITKLELLSSRTGLGFGGAGRGIRPVPSVYSNADCRRKSVVPRKTFRTGRMPRPARQAGSAPAPAACCGLRRLFVMFQVKLYLLAAALMLAGTPVRASPSVSGMLAELSQSDYQGYVEHLVSLGTRYYGTQGNADATAYVGQVFRGFGLATREHLFTLDGYQLANVEATLPGLVRPDDIVIIGAHFDSIASRTPGDPSATNAPGADDNASGTAGVLEIASVLSRYQFAQTIRFIGFNAEEQGMIGSQRYAQAAKDAGDKIVAMVDLDMIGYVNDGAAEDLDIMGNGWLVELMVANVRAFTTLPVTGHVETPMWSDHQYFGLDHKSGQDLA
jgi:hypothetical protein